MADRSVEHTIQLKAKVRSDYLAAQTLCGIQNYNGAANRAYYAVYHAICGVLTDNDIAAEDWDPRVKQEIDELKKVPPQNWKHVFLMMHSTLERQPLGFDRKERAKINAVHDLRIKADYARDDVNDEVEEVVTKDLPEILDSLGVTYT